MNIIDVRFDEHTLETFKTFIGKKMIKYEHVPFRFTNSVPQFVRFCIDGNPWYIYCFSYSAYDGLPNFPLLLKRSKDGFSYPAGIGKVPTIFYNDKYETNSTPARIQSTIGHELKHLIDGDEDDSEDDLCDHFARYLRCPVPYVIIKGYNTSTELISHFGISAEQAGYTLKQVRARVRCYGNHIFENEEEFIDFILDSEE